MDERFWQHRYKSTSHAAMVAALVTAALFFYQQFANGVIRFDYLAIMLAMAVTKIAAMLYYRFRD